MSAEPNVQVVKYSVSVLSMGHEDRHLFEIVVEWRGVPWQVREARDTYDRVWSVSSLMRMVLSRGGKWHYEPSPSNRTLPWCRNHRFTLDEALKQARKQAPAIVVNGRTAVEAAENCRRGVS